MPDARPNKCTTRLQCALLYDGRIQNDEKVHVKLIIMNCLREALKEPHTHVKKAVELLQNETNDSLPEGQLRSGEYFDKN